MAGYVRKCLEDELTRVMLRELADSGSGRRLSTSLELPEDLVRELDEVADRLGISRNELVTCLVLREFLNEMTARRTVRSDVVCVLRELLNVLEEGWKLDLGGRRGGIEEGLRDRDAR
ncbi:ribbon-helix-helix protein, CopG family [Methanopyrus kandleri]|uniref:ribbon-helix-helix protein, CopG family n=1 Tax=Methanopyrus kandleri TaxID=2320 RepID=UPI000AF71309|nr:ribbon-helix-helix protein, CopG family [Methanopyrus kandleri]